MHTLKDLQTNKNERKTHLDKLCVKKQTVRIHWLFPEKGDMKMLPSESMNTTYPIRQLIEHTKRDHPGQPTRS